MGDDGLDMLGEMLMNGLDEMMDGRLMDDDRLDMLGEMLMNGLDDMMDNFMAEMVMMDDDRLRLLGEMVTNGLDEMMVGRMMDNDGLDLLGEMLKNGLEDMTDNLLGKGMMMTGDMLDEMTMSEMLLNDAVLDLGDEMMEAGQDRVIVGMMVVGTTPGVWDEVTDVPATAPAPRARCASNRSQASACGSNHARPVRCSGPDGELVLYRTMMDERMMDDLMTVGVVLDKMTVDPDLMLDEMMKDNLLDKMMVSDDRMDLLDEMLKDELDKTVDGRLMHSLGEMVDGRLNEMLLELAALVPGGIAGIVMDVLVGMMAARMAPVRSEMRGPGLIPSSRTGEMTTAMDKPPPFPSRRRTVPSSASSCTKPARWRTSSPCGPPWSLDAWIPSSVTGYGPLTHLLMYKMLIIMSEMMMNDAVLDLVGEMVVARQDKMVDGRMAPGLAQGMGDEATGGPAIARAPRARGASNRLQAIASGCNRALPVGIGLDPLDSLAVSAKVSR